MLRKLALLAAAVAGYVYITRKRPAVTAAHAEADDTGASVELTPLNADVPAIDDPAIAEALADAPADFAPVTAAAATPRRRKRGGRRAHA